METLTHKRKRITIKQTADIERKIKERKIELGLTKFEIKWKQICDEVKKLNENKFA